ncbi:hypothetical protein JQK88_34830 [Mesorhizobium caraganae]|nr:hypothetical protein [Mesorhizobium caraganae]
MHFKSRQCRLWRPLLVATAGAQRDALDQELVRVILREADIKLGTPSRNALRAACASWPAQMVR